MAKRKPDAILCADLHFRDSQPICRTDDYFVAQRKKIEFLKELCIEINNPDLLVLCAGDVFHKARSSKQLETFLLENILFRIHTIPGNHDLPEHNLNNLDDSSLGIMQAAGKNITVYETPLEQMHVVEIKNRKIGLIHKLTHNETPVTAGETIISYSAKKLLKDFPELDIIVTGDNHQTFTAKYKNRLLINPGSLMRMTADQIDHQPCVYLYCADDNTVDHVYIPIEKNVISRVHIEKDEQYNKRLESYISAMNEQYEVSLSFTKNIEAYFKANEVREPVKEIIWEVIG